MNGFSGRTGDSPFSRGLRSRQAAATCRNRHDDHRHSRDGGAATGFQPDRPATHRRAARDGRRDAVLGGGQGQGSAQQGDHDTAARVPCTRGGVDVRGAVTVREGRRCGLHRGALRGRLGAALRPRGTALGMVAFICYFFALFLRAQLGRFPSSPCPSSPASVSRSSSVP